MNMNMKRMCFLVTAGCCIVALCLPHVVLGGTNSEGGTSGDPPYGVAIQSDAQGTKLYGILFAEFYNQYQALVDGEIKYFGDARVTLRLRQGSKFELFYGEVSNMDQSSPQVAQPVLVGAVAEDVLNYFFSGQLGLKIKLKGLTEYGDLDACSQQNPALNNCLDGSGFAGNMIILADIVLAVK